MPRINPVVVLTAAMAGLTGFATHAQESQPDQKSSKQQQKQDEQKKPQKEQGDSSSGESRGENEKKNENEIRVRYDEKKNRLSVDVDEDIRLGDGKNENGKNARMTRDGNVDLQYDTDRHDLRIRGEGTVNVDRAATAIARWWQTWWEEEKSARRDRRQGLQSGARVFVQQYDDDNDNYLSKDELPKKYRADFDEVDRNEDGYLSRAEIRRSGERFADSKRESDSKREIVTTRKPNADDDDQSWADWWASWWADEDQASSSDRVVRRQLRQNGVNAFIEKHDRNDDGTLVRSELPKRMHDDFDRIDANEDGKLTRKELLREAPLARQADQGDYRAQRERP